MRDEFIRKSDILKFIEDIKCNDDIPKNYGTLLDIMRHIYDMPSFHLGLVEERFRGYADMAAKRMMSGNHIDGFQEYQCWVEALKVLKMGEES